MMATARATLTTSAANVLVSSGNTAVTTMYICNYSGSAATFNMYIVPTSGTAGSSNQIYNTVSIAASDTYVIDMERLILGSGDMIQANANVNSALTMTVSYTGV